MLETTGIQQIVARECANKALHFPQRRLTETSHLPWAEAAEAKDLCATKTPCRGSQLKMRGHQSLVMTCCPFLFLAAAHMDLKTSFLQGEAMSRQEVYFCQIPPEMGYPPFTRARMKKPAYGLGDAP